MHGFSGRGPQDVLRMDVASDSDHEAMAVQGSLKEGKRERELSRSHPMHLVHVVSVDDASARERPTLKRSLQILSFLF